MKKTFIVLTIVAIAYVACKKDNLTTTSSTVYNEIGTLFTDTVEIPINDLAKGTYYGFAGGLYPNSKNTPSGKYANDLLKFAGQIQPLDTFGNPSPDGWIGFAAVGGSTCASTMNALRPKTIDNPLTNPYLRLATLSTGSLTIDEIMNPNDPFWLIAADKLATSELHAKQVQVIYMEADDSTETTDFPGRSLRAKDKIAGAMRTFKIKYPNIKLVYLTGRTHSFVDLHKNGNNYHNVEPNPYRLSFTCKWLIEDQINGVNNLNYKGNRPVSPLITWGFYEWTNGTSTPRKDGFVWTEDLTSDGLHGNDVGDDTLTNRFQTFLLTDINAKKWYANNTMNK